MSFVSPDILLHLANILLLLAYLVRSILWLRCFALASSAFAIPYFLLQSNVLWPPVGWSAVFIIVNLVQIGLLLWERRPVVLSDEEQKLYDMGFQKVSRRDFVSLMMIGQWSNGAAGDRILTEGKPCEAICVAISGTIEVRRHERVLAELEPGRVVGTAIALIGEPSPIDAVFVEPARYMCWSLPNVRTFLDRKPELRNTLQRMTSHDLATKLQHLASAGT